MNRISFSLIEYRSNETIELDPISQPGILMTSSGLGSATFNFTGKRHVVPPTEEIETTNEKLKITYYIILHFLVLI